MKFLMRVIVAMLAMVVGVFLTTAVFTLGKLGVRDVDGVSFQRVVYLEKYDCVFFDDTLMKRLIWNENLYSISVDRENVLVVIDSRFKDVTAIAVVPEWYEYFLPSAGFAHARKVTVLVADKAEKEKWEGWLENCKNKGGLSRELQLRQYKKVDPPDF